MSRNSEITKIALDALTEILKGSQITGRWLDDDGEPLDGDDCHNADADPNKVYADDEDAALPYRWFPYDLEDQADWTETCARIAGDAIQAIRAARKAARAAVAQS